jgi:hypothetical protein
MTTETAAQIIARKHAERADQARQIRHFCDLRKEVNRKVFGFSTPSDCLCDRKEDLPEGWQWQDSGKVTAYIESAVLWAIEQGYELPRGGN